MAGEPVTVAGSHVDLSSRTSSSGTVAGSPALAAETIVCQIPALSGSATTISGVWLSGGASFTVGTSGTAVTMRIRQTNVAGSVVATTGALTGGIAAGNLVSQDVQGFDASPPSGGVYVLTLQVTSGAAASTVTQTNLFALNV
jgi:hypothetical protein